MKKWLWVVACGLLWLGDGSRAEAQGGEENLRLFLDVDLFRWTKLRIPDEGFLAEDVDLTTHVVGPFGLANGALTSLVAGGAGYAIADVVVINGAFGVSRAKDPDLDETVLSLRVQPDVDVWLMQGTVRPYATVGVPIAFAKVDGDGFALKDHSVGPQVGLGVMLGPVHAEVTFAALFGKSKLDETGFDSSDQKFRELSVGLVIGASYWL